MLTASSTTVLYTKINSSKYSWCSINVELQCSLRIDHVAIGFDYAGGCAAPSEEQARADGQSRCSLQTAYTEAQVSDSSIVTLFVIAYY
jgi:hypothetical protein